MAPFFSPLREKLPKSIPGNSLLWMECLLLFGCIPGVLIYFQRQGGIHFLPTLLGMLSLTFLLSLFDPRIKYQQPGSRVQANAYFPKVILRVLAAALLLILLTALHWPELLFRLPRERPALWLLILLLYPLFSVLPQHFLFRIYFMQRYQSLFGNGRTMLCVNALFFSWAHAFFLNSIAPLLTLIAGFIFADTWQRTRNTRITCLEHALYGQLIFTVGLGWFFYNGSAQVVQTLID